MIDCSAICLLLICGLCLQLYFYPSILQLTANRGLQMKHRYELGQVVKFRHPMFGALKHGYGKIAACDLENGIMVSINGDEVFVPYRNIVKVLG